MNNHLSVSQMKLYLLCPLKYWYERARQGVFRAILHADPSPVRTLVLGRWRCSTVNHTGIRVCLRQPPERNA